MGLLLESHCPRIVLFPSSLVVAQGTVDLAFAAMTFLLLVDDAGRRLLCGLVAVSDRSPVARVFRFLGTTCRRAPGKQWLITLPYEVDSRDISRAVHILHQRFVAFPNELDIRDVGVCQLASVAFPDEVYIGDVGRRVLNGNPGSSRQSRLRPGNWARNLRFGVLPLPDKGFSIQVHPFDCSAGQERFFVREVKRRAVGSVPSQAFKVEVGG